MADEGHQGQGRVWKMEIFFSSPPTVSFLQAGSMQASVGEGGGHGPGGWQCGKGWTTSAGSTLQLNQFRVIMKSQGSLSFLSPAISLLEVPIQVLVSLLDKRGRRMRLLCAVLNTKQQVKPYSSRNIREHFYQFQQEPCRQTACRDRLGEFQEASKQSK